MNKKTINPSQVKLLWGKSAGRCSICKEILHKPSQECENFLIGEMAHIEGENPGSARYKKNMSDEDRNAYGNLILLCPTHHTIVDKDENKYTVEALKQKKSDHERWVGDSLRNQIVDITFAELEVILKYLSSAPLPTGGKPLTVISPDKKIKRNDLSPDVGKLITMGMMQKDLIKEYLNKHPDLQFASCLSKGLADKYDKLRNDGLTGDALFYELMDFTSNYSNDFKRKTAGLSVLTYFFEICDIFE
jgi:hypothetical protein